MRRGSLRGPTPRSSGTRWDEPRSEDLESVQISEEDPGLVVGCPDAGGAKHEPPRVVPELGQGADCRAKCPQIRLGWVVSQTPRAAFHVARGGGDGGGGEESSYILDHQEVRAEGFDRTCHVQPKAGSGFGVEAGAVAGNREVFDRGNLP